MLKKVLILFLFCPILWFLLIHLNTTIHEWAKLPLCLYQGVHSLFTIDKIRYSVELNGSNFLSRIFYNKISYLVGVFFNGLSTVTPRNIFVGQDFELIPIIFLPFWFFGVFKLIRDRKYWWFITVAFTGILIYLTGQTSPYYLFFLVPFYLYAICY